MSRAAQALGRPCDIDARSDLVPTVKLKRRVLEQHFAAEIEQLYA